MLRRLVRLAMRRTVSGRARLAMRVAGVLWRRMRRPTVATTVVRVPRGTRVVVHAVRDAP